MPSESASRQAASAATARPAKATGIAAALETIRAEFPALSRRHGGRHYSYLDGPGGTQVPRRTIEAMVRYLETSNANHEGAFATSQESDAILAEAHAAAADFLGADGPDQVVFGQNMTTLTFAVSRAIGRTLRAGDEVVVTRLDHDANVAPWLALEEERGVAIRWVGITGDDCRLDLAEVEKALGPRTRVVAVGLASNAVGTINPVRKMTEMAHAAGALVYVDAVQYAPHGPIDVRALGVDFLVCSSYKFFGPHAAALYGRYELLDELKAYKVRPAPDLPPGKFETGTQNHEGIAGVLGALEYLEWLGKTFGGDQEEGLRESGYRGRRLELKKAMTAIRAREFELSRSLLTTLAGIPGLRLYGPADARRLDQRVPTFSFTLAGMPPRQVAEKLAAEGINVWDGNYYALAVTERLGLETGGGMVRVGAVHYNTLDEVGRLGDVLKSLR